VVLLYMGDDVNLRLRPILQKTLKPGARIVSHRFTMGDWTPTRSETFTGEDGDEYEVHLWVIGEPTNRSPARRASKGNAASGCFMRGERQNANSRVPETPAAILVSR
jgi:hypothetical protein